MAHSHVFVGNLPYDVNEETLQALLEKCGKVRNVRLLTDPATGKLKGFGFCEFADEASALCAIKNLNGKEFGGRQLKVDYADKPKLTPSTKPEPDRTTARPMPVPAPNFGGPMDAHRQVANALNTLPLPELYEAVEQLKYLATHNPEHAKQILYANPQLGLATFYVLHHMGIYEKDPRLGIPEHRAGTRSAPMAGHFSPAFPGVPRDPLHPSFGFSGSRGQHPMMAPFGAGPPGMAMPSDPAFSMPLPAGPPIRSTELEPFALAPTPILGLPASPPLATPALAAPPPLDDADNVIPQLAQLDADQLQQLLTLTPDQLADLSPAERDQVQRIQSQLASLAGAL